LRKLEAVTPVTHNVRVLPTDPVSFARGLLAGEFVVGDIDPEHPDHMGWVSRLNAFWVMLSSADQEWLQIQGEPNTRAYPDGLLLPATDEATLAVLDEVMRRG
jgi:hypothetical protein